MAEEMRRDERVIALATTRAPALENEFGKKRVRFTPISEAAFTGIGLGAAGSGFRPVVHWGMVTFSFVAMDQIVNQASKIRYMFGGQADFPVTYRCTTGGGAQTAAQQSQSPYSMFMHLAGLKIILPSTPADAKGLLKSAIRDNNPVISFECSRLASITGPVPDGDYTIPIGVADVKRAGNDVTVVGLAYYVREALAVADELAAEGISIEIIDPRTLVPMDAEAIRVSVRRTGRLVVVDGAQVVPAGEVELFPVIAAEGDVGSGRSPVDDAAELLAPWIHDPDASGSAAVDVAFDIYLHAVGDAGFVAPELGEDPIRLLRERAVGQQVECPDVSAPSVVDVEHRFIRREGEAVGQHEVGNEQAHRAQIGRDAVHSGKGQIPLLGSQGAGPRVGEVDAAVGFDHDVVGTVEPPTLEAVRDHGEAAVELLPRDAPAVMLAGNQPALEIPGQPVGPVRRLQEHRHALGGDVLHAPVVMDVAEQQKAAFLPPERPFGRPLGSAESFGQLLDGFWLGDDLF